MRRSDDLKRLDRIAQAIYDKKGATIIAIDVREICSFTEYFLIAEGSVERHVTALAKSVIETQKEEGHIPIHVEGLDSDWAVVDYGHIVVHLFKPELREKYALETFWQEGKIVDIDLKIA